MNLQSYQVNAQTAVLLNDTSSANHHGCALVIEMIKKKCAENNIQITHTVPLRQSWELEKNQTEINQSDMVIVNAEGSVHSSREFAFHLISIARYCKQKKKKCFFINGVYQNNGEVMHQEMAFFDAIFVREGYSKSELDKQNLHSEVVPDMIFGCEDFDLIKNTTELPSYTLYTDSVLQAVTQYLYKDFLAKDNHDLFITMRREPKNKKSFRNFIKDILNFLRPKRKGPANISGWGKNAYCPNRDDFVSIIKNAELVVSGRFHMICLCIILDVPFIAIASNSHKIEALLKDAELPDRLFDMTVSQSLAEWRASNPWTKNHSDKVQKYLINARMQINQMYAKIASSD